MLAQSIGLSTGDALGLPVSVINSTTETLAYVEFLASVREMTCCWLLQTPGEGEVLVDVRASGICGTDVHVKNDAFPYWPPVILGHEFSGVVVELGTGCKHYQIGDRVDCGAAAEDKYSNADCENPSSGHFETSIAACAAASRASGTR